MNFNSNIISISDILEKKKIDANTFQKMHFVYNALDNGWTIKKKGTSFVFTKKKEKEVFEDSFLINFIKSNTDINKLLF